MNDLEKDQDPRPGAGTEDCPKCGRRTPADRLNCLYCGAALELTDDQKMLARTVLRKVDLWESGWNVIVTSSDGGSKREAATLLRLEGEDAESLFASESPVPAARMAVREEAEVVVKQLAALGIEAIAVADETLDPRNPPRRLRGLEFTDDAIRPVLFNDPGQDRPALKPVLFVLGFLNRKRLESTEKRSRGSEKIIDSAETGVDETVIDIYGDSDPGGFRIRQEGFDFSCLGDKKAFTASENIRLVLQELRDRFPEAGYCGTYRASRRALGVVWPQSESMSSEGVERQSFRGYAKKKVAVTDNEEQFTRFSRVMNLLCES